MLLSNANSASSEPVVNKTDAVAVVNGHYIAKANLAKLEKEVAERSHGQIFSKEKLVEELIQRELLVQDAEQKKLDKSAEVLAQLDSTKRTLLTQADVQDFTKANPVTDAEIKADYDIRGTEYKARPIEAVKEELRAYLQSKKVQAMVENLRKQAKIEILAPLTNTVKSEIPAEQPVTLTTKTASSKRDVSSVPYNQLLPDEIPIVLINQTKAINNEVLAACGAYYAGVLAQSIIENDSSIVNSIGDYLHLNAYRRDSKIKMGLLTIAEFDNMHHLSSILWMKSDLNWRKKQFKLCLDFDQGDMFLYNKFIQK